MPNVVGKFRKRPSVPGEENTVIYNFGDDPEDEMTEKEYRMGCYHPPFEELTWTN
jgi:hypothetical protein